MTAPLLLEYFKVRDAAVKVDASKEEGGEKALLDGKRIQMLGIMFKKFVFANKGLTEQEAVFSLKRAMLQCDYDVMKQEFLPLIRQVLRQHEADGNKVSKYVRAHGEAALAHLPQSDYHRFVHELLKVPQVDERLECMMLEMVYDETLEKIRRDVAVLRDALSVIEAKTSLLRSFFATAHRLGQGLNRDSRTTQAQRGFQLRALQKLAQTKSPRSPKHSVLHFALALLTPSDARQLFTAKDAAALRQASALGSFNVYQDCLLAVQGLEDVREICETGTFTVRSTGAQVKIERRRITVAPSRKAGEGAAAGGAGEAEAPIDVDDCFHERMRVFVESRLGDAKAVAMACYRVFQRYKDVALFLDDLGTVYPPPRDDRDPSRCDLFTMLYKLAEDIRTHAAEVERDHLRELLDTSSGLHSKG